MMVHNKWLWWTEFQKMFSIFTKHFLFNLFLLYLFKILSYVLQSQKITKKIKKGIKK